eukprot:3754436-Lingulodinium_polyedra.AAC.1
MGTPWQYSRNAALAPAPSSTAASTCMEAGMAKTSAKRDAWPAPVRLGLPALRVDLPPPGAFLMS